MADEKDDKLEALNKLIGDEKFRKLGDKYEASFGGLGTEPVIAKLTALGLKEDRDFKVTDPKGGTIEINPDKLPDPKGDPDAYVNLADHGVSKNLKKLKEATGLKFTFDGNQYLSPTLTKTQADGLATLDDDIKTKPAFKALLGNDTTKKDLLAIEDHAGINFTPDELEKKLGTIAQNKNTIRNALGTQVDEKLEALNNFIGDEKFKKFGDKYQASFGGLNTDSVIAKLKALGLKEDRDFKVTDPKGGTIEINPDKLPDPKGDSDAYKKLADHDHKVVTNPLHASMLQAGPLTAMAVPHSNQPAMHEIGEFSSVGAPGSGKGSHTV